MGPSGLGWAPDTGPTRAGLLFAFLGPRDPSRFLDEEKAACCALGPAGPRGSSRGGASARLSVAGTRSRAGIRLRVFPREVFT